MIAKSLRASTADDTELEAKLRRFVDERRSIADIAAALGVSDSVTYRLMGMFDLKANGKPGRRDPGPRSPRKPNEHTEIRGYINGMLAIDAQPIGQDRAEERQWREIGEWPVDLAFDDAPVPHERSMGKVGRGDTISGCSSAAAICTEGGGGSTGHWRVRRSL